MNTKGSVVVFFVCFLTLFTLTDCSTCQTQKLAGSSLSLKLADKPLQDGDRFTVKKDDKVLVSRKNKKQNGPGRIKNEVLEFPLVGQNYSGKYTVETFDSSGRNLKLYTETICVYAKVPKPRVNVTCQGEKINLRCEVEGDAGLTFTWHQNGKELTTNKEQALTNLEQNQMKYACTAHNPVDRNTSDPETATCPGSDMLLGFERWTMVGILAGGGGLTLFFIILVVTLSCCSCKRRKKHQRDEEEFRLNYINTSQSPEKLKQTARGQPAPPEPMGNGPAQDLVQPPGHTAPRTRNQQRARPPPPPIDDDEEQPPPLPQPRKKPQAKKREGPL